MYIYIFIYIYIFVDAKKNISQEVKIYFRFTEKMCLHLLAFRCNWHAVVEWFLVRFPFQSFPMFVSCGTLQMSYVRRISGLDLQNSFVLRRCLPSSLWHRKSITRTATGSWNPRCSGVWIHTARLQPHKRKSKEACRFSLNDVDRLI